jgi:peptidoglycan hydrolase-like protein with peptidoglycan-binding domain
MLLKLGSKGPEVVKLQTALGITADGNFGPGTEKVLKEWQAKTGLTADGIAGAATFQKLGLSPIENAVSESAPAAEVPASDFKLAALKGHVPDAVIAQIPDTAKKFNITNLIKIGSFLGSVWSRVRWI